ncbi:MAG: glycosyltransferase [Burkholderiaceae bacterium]|nr:glycosyltransferase [Burkholderiaceae bacterium]
MIRASVIIPTRDRADLLERCLAALTRQTLAADEFEVVVVDNGSRDATAQVAAGYATHLALRCIVAPEPGLHVGRHAGMRAARSDVLMYTDDDAEPEPTWVEAVAQAFEDPAVGLVGGNDYPRFEGDPPAWLQRWWNEPVYRGRALGYLSVLDFGSGRFPLAPEYVWGCNFSIRRQALETVSGFHPDGVPRDLMRLRGDGESYVASAIVSRGWKAIFDSRASVHHLVPPARMTRDYFEQRGFAQGVSDSYSAVRRHRGASLPLSERLRTRLRPAAGSLKARWKMAGSRDPAASTLLEVRLSTLRAWARGFAFHQSALRSDPDLLGWVLKDNYLG